MMQLNNYEKMALTIPSTANEWPQIDDQNLMASTNMGVDKPTQEQIQQQQQQAQKCPRCDSSNTKFCYYNNYSLSQPRHFCKACKRYWTRGGTLRNVPVGGGCRKNKRVKRPAAAGTTSMALDSSSVNISSSSTPMATIKPNNSLFYHGLQHSSMNPNSSELNLSFDSRIEGAAGHHLYEYDLQPQMGSLGFPSSGHIVSNSDLLSRSMLSSYHHLPNYGSLNSSLSATPTMASLHSSNLPQQRYVSNGVSGDARSGGGNFHGFSHYEGHMQGSHNDHDGGSSMKVLRKEESDHNRSNNQIQQLGSSDPNSIFWNANGGGSWHDPANSIGSSVPSLI